MDPEPPTISPQQLEIRPFRPDDLAAIYSICLRTGDAGADASGLYRDLSLIGHVYAGPYVALEPDICFVLASLEQVLGYILGTRDSHRFGRLCERAWYPALRQHYPAPAAEDTGKDARMRRLIHLGYRPDLDLAAWPAHLHVDLLPEVQGKGWGGKLLDRFLGRMREAEVCGVHVLTGPGNPRAMAFYLRAGFTPIKESAGTIAYGMRLRDSEVVNESLRAG